MSVAVNAERPKSSRRRGKSDKPGKHKGLLAVAIFKLLKAIFFAAVGIGALKMLNHDLTDVVMRITAALHFDPEGRFVGFLMNRADLVGNHQLRQVGFFSLLYACVCIVEGIGLYRERTWAEYFTVTLTVLALPYELWELFREPTAMRAGLVALNVIVLVYLLWLIRLLRSGKRAH